MILELPPGSSSEQLELVEALLNIPKYGELLTLVKMVVHARPKAFEVAAAPRCDHPGWERVFKSASSLLRMRRRIVAALGSDELSKICSSWGYQLTLWECPCIYFQYDYHDIIPHEVAAASSGVLPGFVAWHRAAAKDDIAVGRAYFLAIQPCNSSLPPLSTDAFRKTTLEQAEQHVGSIGFPIMDARELNESLAMVLNDCAVENCRKELECEGYKVHVGLQTPWWRRDAGMSDGIIHDLTSAQKGLYRSLKGMAMMSESVDEHLDARLCRFILHQAAAAECLDQKSKNNNVKKKKKNNKKKPPRTREDATVKKWAQQAERHHNALQVQLPARRWLFTKVLATPPAAQ